MTAIQAQAMTRSQSTAATRHRSAIVTSSAPPPLPSQSMEYSIPASVPEESETRASSKILVPTTPAYHPSTSSRGNPTLAPTSPTTQTHPISVDADPFSYDTRRISSISPVSAPMSTSLSAPPNPPATYAEDQTMAEGIKRGESRRRHAEMLPPPLVVPSSPTSRSSRRSSVKASGGTPARESTSSAAAIELERRKKSHRATVQVEYDGGSSAKGKEREILLETDSSLESDIVMVGEVTQTSPDLVTFSKFIKFSSTRILVLISFLSLLDLPPTINTTRLESIHASGTSTPPLAPIPYPSTPPQESPLASPSSGTPRKRKSTGSPKVPSIKDRANTPPPVPEASPQLEQSPKTIEKDTPNSPGAFSLSSNGDVRPPTHKKGVKSIDRFSIRALLGGGSPSGSTLERTQSQNARRASTSNSKTADAVRAAEAEALEKERALEEVTNARRQSRRQKAMSLQPFKTGTASSKLTRTPKLEAGETFASISMPRTRSSTVVPSLGMPPPPRPYAGATNSRILPTSASTTNKFSDVEANWNSSQASATPSGKANAVMAWFRRRSTRGMPSPEIPQSPIATDFDRRSSVLPSIPSSSAIEELSLPFPTTEAAVSTPMVKAPSVIVTAAVNPEPERYAIDARGERSVPASRSASGAQSHLSQMSAVTTSTLATTASNSSSTIHAPPLGAAFTNAKLRIHQGALDKKAITSKSPQLVIVDLRNALWKMGIDVVQEGEFSKCRLILNFPISTSLILY